MLSPSSSSCCSVTIGLFTSASRHYNKQTWGKDMQMPKQVNLILLPLS